ncbi:MAG: hypothetical protein LBN11_02365, partial [Tannerella sp.]|nr:hypothetical protein [Tannerella sp.]
MKDIKTILLLISGIVVFRMKYSTLVTLFLVLLSCSGDNKKNSVNVTPIDKNENLYIIDMD